MSSIFILSICFALDWAWVDLDALAEKRATKAFSSATFSLARAFSVASCVRTVKEASM